MGLIVGVLVGILPFLAAIVFMRKMPQQNLRRATRSLVIGLTGFNGLVILIMLGLVAISLISPSTVLAKGSAQAESPSDQYVALAAALSTGLATIGAGIAVGTVGSAAVGAIAEKPESFGRALIFVGLAEGIAIYGLIISFMILNR